MVDITFFARNNQDRNIRISILNFQKGVVSSNRHDTDMFISITTTFPSFRLNIIMAFRNIFLGFFKEK